MSDEIGASGGGQDLWTGLRTLTPARIGASRAGSGLATGDALQLQLAHAEAHDAIAAALDVESMVATLRDLGHQAIVVRSRAPDRATFIRRPDLGRLLAADSAAELAAAAQPGGYDVVFMLADGLSSLALQRHALEVVTRVHRRLTRARWSIAPIVVATQARVALADPVGAALSARISVILIGERPGLSCADSLGAYVTWNPEPGRTDADRNCISNIHPGGLSYDDAEERLSALLSAARAGQLTGTRLMFDSLVTQADSGTP